MWFFFETPVPAADARKPGSLLLTRAMARRHELSFKSNDRLFPSQDTMPKGGFGNLVALSFQGQAQKNGTVVAVGYNDDGQYKVSGWTDIKRPNRANAAD